MTMPNFWLVNKWSLTNTCLIAPPIWMFHLPRCAIILRGIRYSFDHRAEPPVADFRARMDAPTRPTDETRRVSGRRAWPTLASRATFFERGVADTVRAGYADPAHNATDLSLSIDRYLIDKPSESLLFAVRGDSMNRCWHSRGRFRRHRAHAYTHGG